MGKGQDGISCCKEKTSGALTEKLPKYHPGAPGMLRQNPKIQHLALVPIPQLPFPDFSGESLPPALQLSPGGNSIFPRRLPPGASAALPKPIMPLFLSFCPIFLRKLGYEGAAGASVGFGARFQRHLCPRIGIPGFFLRGYCEFPPPCCSQGPNSHFFPD